MRKLGIIGLALCTLSCTQKQEPEATVKANMHPERHHSHIVAPMRSERLEGQEVAVGMGMIKDLLERNQGERVKTLASGVAATGGTFVAGVDKYLDLFLKEDVTFQCKGSAVLVCQVVNSHKQPVMKMRLVGQKHQFFEILFGAETEGHYLMQFCDARKPIMIHKEDSSFWDDVKHMAPGAMSRIYEHSEEAPFNGALLLIKGKGEIAEVIDFRVSVGPVEKGSEEYKEFVSEDCTQYKSSKSEL